MEHEDDEPDTGIHTIDEENVSQRLSTQFHCNFCSKTFSSKSNIMMHKKQDHEENVATCWKFIAGECRFSDEKCWFNHCKNKLEDIDEIECNWCDKVFMTQPEFLNHRYRNYLKIGSWSDIRWYLPKQKIVWNYFLRLEVHLQFRKSDHLPATKARFDLINR